MVFHTGRASIDEIIKFINDNAPKRGEHLEENPFKGPRFPLAKVERAIAYFHRHRSRLDLAPYDLPGTYSLWTSQDRVKNYPLGRHAMHALVTKLAADQPGVPLEQVVTHIKADDFHVPLNRYGTRLSGMLMNLYGNSPFKAAEDLVARHPAYSSLPYLQPFDMHMAPQNTWILKDGSPNFRLARIATPLLLRALRLKKRRSWRETILGLTSGVFAQTPINRYGTTLNGMLQMVYRDCVNLALQDLAVNDSDYLFLAPFIEERRQAILRERGIA